MPAKNIEWEVELDAIQVDQVFGWGGVPLRLARIERNITCNPHTYMDGSGFIQTVPRMPMMSITLEFEEVL